MNYGGAHLAKRFPIRLTLTKQGGIKPYVHAQRLQVVQIVIYGSVDVKKYISKRNVEKTNNR